MTLKIKLNISRELIVVFLAAVSLVLIVFVAAPAQSKLAAQASQTASCTTKINEEACNTAVKKECDKFKNKPSEYTDCLVKTIGRFQNKSTGQAGGTLSNDALQKAAVKNCNTGNDDQKSACRNGFRHGYRNDETLNEACINRSIYNDSEKEACKKGYAAGKDLRESGAGTEEEVPGFGKNVKNTSTHKCGNNGDTQVTTKFNFGCLGDSYPGDSLNPIEDVIYAIIRFLSAGVGIIVVLAIILAGIKYSSSEGNPEATQDAKNKIRSTLIGLLVYIFAFSLIQYLVPGGVFN